MKKIATILLSAALIASTVPTDSYAALASSSTAVSGPVVPAKKVFVTNNTDPSDQKLESAILAVKKVIDIPESYSKFDYNFNSQISYRDSSWNLTWSNPTDNSSITVNCDMDNHITYFSKYDGNSSSKGLVKYLKSEQKSTADSFIKKIAPEIFDSLEYTKADYDSVYSGNYIYYYQRKNNGIDFPDNSVSITVNSTSGEVIGATVNWLYGVAVPSAQTKISKSEAAELIKKNMKMKLVYHTNYYHIYDSSDNTPQKAFLVYEPSQNYISIDATTGKVYSSRSEWIYADGGNGYKSGYAKTDDIKEAASNALAKEETEKVEDLKGLISKEEAIKKITENKSLYLEDTLTSYTATLQKLSNNKGNASYVWDINLRDPREVKNEKKPDTYRAYAYATVDAKTGKILSFYSSMKSNYNETKQKWETVKVKYSKDQSRKILEKFLKNQIKDRIDNAVLTDEKNDYIAYYKSQNPIYGGYSYAYNRVNEGVEFPDNNISGSVDGVTGKIYSFGSYWFDNIAFESTNGAISAEDAMKYYLNNEGYGLKYEINMINKDASKDKPVPQAADITNQYNVEYNIRLVYRPDVNPSYLSPFTGKQLNSDGKEYEQVKPYTYKDIDDSEANRNIQMLTDMGIGFKGEYFQPNKYITVEEINQLIDDITGGVDDAEQASSGNTVTKEKLAQMFITKLGMEKIAQLKGIYKVDYNDAGDIDAQYLGAVALANGLGIMTADTSNSFKPKSNVTRYDAVNYILNFINAQQVRVY
jgi:Peptidase propeptide and YPEB domain./S-layer homology domain.